MIKLKNKNFDVKQKKKVFNYTSGFSHICIIKNKSVMIVLSRLKKNIFFLNGYLRKKKTPAYIKNDSK